MATRFLFLSRNSIHLIEPFYIIIIIIIFRATYSRISTFYSFVDLERNLICLSLILLFFTFIIIGGMEKLFH